MIDDFLFQSHLPGEVATICGCVYRNHLQAEALRNGGFVYQIHHPQLLQCGDCVFQQTHTHLLEGDAWTGVDFGSSHTLHPEPDFSIEPWNEQHSLQCSS